jgi:hypothetical protein
MDGRKTGGTTDGYRCRRLEYIYIWKRRDVVADSDETRLFPSQIRAQTV